MFGRRDIAYATTAAKLLVACASRHWDGRRPTADAHGWFVFFW
jgi:hypothetical protein